eukprot:6795558-Alexandrium_andersonii.AAC.1
MVGRRGAPEGAGAGTCAGAILLCGLRACAVCWHDALCPACKRFEARSCVRGFEGGACASAVVR